MNKEINSILLVRTSAIGDVIQTFPVLHYLRQKFPKARIDWVVEKPIAPLLEAHPFLSQVICIDSKTWRKNPFAKPARETFGALKEYLKTHEYGVAFDLQANIKSAVVMQLVKAKEKVGFDGKGVREKGNLLFKMQRIAVVEGLEPRLKYLSLSQSYFGDEQRDFSSCISLCLKEEEQHRLKEALIQMGSDFRWMVCFGSKWPNKQLPIATWIDLLKRVEAAFPSTFLFVFGDGKEREVAEGLQAHFPKNSFCIGGMTLALWQALMQEMDGVLAVDSAALHLCGTTETSSFSIFGPSLATMYKPKGEQHHAYQGACPYGQKFAMRCPKLRTCKTGACMSELQAQELFDAFQRWARSNVSRRSKSM